VRLSLSQRVAWRGCAVGLFLSFSPPFAFSSCLVWSAPQTQFASSASLAELHFRPSVHDLKSNEQQLSSSDRLDSAKVGSPFQGIDNIEEAAVLFVSPQRYLAHRSGTPRRRAVSDQQRADGRKRLWIEIASEGEIERAKARRQRVLSGK
jgi:hypothetical protein